MSGHFILKGTGWSLLYALSLCLYISFAGCRASYTQEGDALMASAARLHQQHLMLQTRVDSLWDTTSAQLAQYIPEDFPPVDKKIFLTSRNADHIRMFMTFHQLDPQAQALVHHAGDQDQRLASQVQDLQNEIDALQVKRYAFLNRLSREDETQYRHYADAFAVSFQF